MMHQFLPALWMWPSPASLGSPSRTMGRTTSWGFGMDHDQRVDLHQWQSGFTARAVLALLLWVADEEAVCVPTWVVLTSGCRVSGEIGGVSVPGKVKAGPLCECGRTCAALEGMWWEEPRRA